MAKLALQPSPGAAPRGFYNFRADDGITRLARAWPKQTSMIPGKVFLSTNLLDEIEEFLRDLNVSDKRFQYGMNAMVRILAMYQQGHAMQMSRGPVDPRQTNPNAAWKIPVRRITSHYYQGWQVKRIAPGVWQVFNPTREAYYIEFGISVYGGRVRRPIRKLSLIRTLKTADSSKLGYRVWEEIFGPLRGKGARYKRGVALTNVSPQSGPVMPYMGSGFGGAG